MLYTYDKRNNEFKACEPTLFSEHGLTEPREIEDFVVDNCSEIMGEELLVISRQYSGFDTNERPDIMAINQDGKLVIIELKRDDSGKVEDMQALKYAAYSSTMTFKKVVEIRMEYLERYHGETKQFQEVEEEILDFLNTSVVNVNSDGKPKVILVSRYFRKQVTSTVLWLLDNTDLDISCMQLTPYILDDNTLGISISKIIPFPEATEYFVGLREKKEDDEINKKASSESFIHYERLGKGIVEQLNNSTEFGNDWAYHAQPSFCVVFKEAWRRRHPNGKRALYPFYDYMFTYVHKGQISLKIIVLNHPQRKDYIQSITDGKIEEILNKRPGNFNKTRKGIYAERITNDFFENEDASIDLGIRKMKELISQTIEILNSASRELPEYSFID